MMWRRVALLDVAEDGFYLPNGKQPVAYIVDRCTTSRGPIDGIGVVIAWLDRNGVRPGAKLRVAVEEEVDACCEKWRDLLNPPEPDGSRWLTLWHNLRPHAVCPVGPFLNCPECGKRL
jgi:hypothetical protein